MKNYDWFSEIRENNIAALRSVQKAEWNVLESFGDLNIEPLHFIFELLQNADDQKAKKAKFIFSDTQIQFFHNGTTFKKKDVKGICGYAVKIKTQDNQKIGKFGLGFKSVYQFTDVPKIFTEVEGEPLNFLIENECVPDLIELTDNEILNELNQFGKTGFLFNLKTDIQDRLEEQLQTFIEKYSQKILMYLQHIKKIEIISKNSNIVISKKRIGDQIIEILYLKNSKKIIQRNFVFSYEIEEILKKYGDNIPPIKISFKMKNENFVKDQETSKLNVFLPTMEETGFYFDIHAPFKLDAGRAHLSKSQKNISFNQALMYEVCNAITKSILELKRLSLINSSFIELLPIEDDPQPENFVDVRESIDKCLREENIWPILQKGYSSIKKVIQARKI